MQYQEKRLSGFLLFDGGLETALQSRGFVGTPAEVRARTGYRETVERILGEYRQAGAAVLRANTAGVNEAFFPESGRLEQVIAEEIDLARRAGAELIALPIAPLGPLMAPMGTLTFREAYRQFGRIIRAGAQAGADLVVFQTMSDPLETKAGILAAREQSALPVLCSMSYEVGGRTFAGCDPVTATLLLQGLGVDGQGANCVCGPDQMLPQIRQIVQHAGAPVLAMPNAGYPVAGRELERIGIWEMGPEEFAGHMLALARAGARLLGGCCGTTPGHIRALCGALDRLPAFTPVASRAPAAALTSRTRTLWGAEMEGCARGEITVPERPDFSELLVNTAEIASDKDLLQVRLCGGDRVEEAVQMIQGATSTPLELVAESAEVLLEAARAYAGIPLLCLEGGDAAALDALSAQAKRYGARVSGRLPALQS